MADALGRFTRDAHLVRVLCQMGQRYNIETGNIQMGENVYQDHIDSYNYNVTVKEGKGVLLLDCVLSGFPGAPRKDLACGD